jgi:hypothetical protein
MTEPNNRELNDKIADIREWLVRIDTRLDYLNEVKLTSERAEQKADLATQQANTNAKAIDRMQTTTKWAIGLTVTSIIGIIAVVVSAVL